MGYPPYRKVVPSDEYFAFSSRFHPIFELCGVLNLCGNEFQILFRTDNEILAKMWKVNFPQEKNLIIPDGIIEIYSGNGPSASVRLYDKQNHRMIITDHASYGCVKFAYRVICSDLMKKKNLLPLHSGAVIINGKLVLVTGPSGSGKNTTFTYLDQRHDGLFLWDDWGVVSMLGETQCTNETAFHMSETSVKSIISEFNDWERMPCEDGHAKKYMVPVDIYRKVAYHQHGYNPIKIDCLVILTNIANIVSVCQVKAEEAIKVFTEPSYSYAWDCKIPFMNEHIMMSNSELITLGSQYKHLFSHIPNIIVANNNKLEKDKAMFLSEVEKAILG